MGPGELEALQAVASFGRQLVDDHRGHIKLTGCYAVRQATKGGKEDRPKSIFIDCYGHKRTVEEKNIIMAEYRKQQVASKGSLSQAAPATVLKEPSPPPKSDVDAGVTAKRSNQDIGSDSVDNIAYPGVINSSHVLLSLGAAKKGVMRLA